jgi:tetratricopeptide (TPR) repeat protein
MFKVMRNVRFVSTLVFAASLASGQDKMQQEWKAKLDEAQQAAQAGATDKAEKLYADALKKAARYRTREQQMGGLAVLSTLQSRARFYAAQKRYDKAESDFKEVLAMRGGESAAALSLPRLEELALVEQLGARNPSIAFSMEELADVYAAQNRDQEANVFYWRAVTILDTHPRKSERAKTAALMEKYARFLRQFGGGEEAAVSYEKKAQELASQSPPAPK